MVFILGPRFQLTRYWKWYKQILVFLGGDFHQHPLFQFRGMIWNAFLQNNSSYEVNSLWPSDAIWHHVTWSPLVQVMACCLTAPTQLTNNHSEVQWHSFKGNFMGDTSAINNQNWLEHYPSKISFKSLRDQWVNSFIVTKWMGYARVKCRKKYAHGSWIGLVW